MAHHWAPCLSAEGTWWPPRGGCRKGDSLSLGGLCDWWEGKEVPQRDVPGCPLSLYAAEPRTLASCHPQICCSVFHPRQTLAFEG